MDFKYEWQLYSISVWDTAVSFSRNILQEFLFITSYNSLSQAESTTILLHEREIWFSRHLIRIKWYKSTLDDPYPSKLKFSIFLNIRSCLYFTIITLLLNFNFCSLRNTQCIFYYSGKQQLKTVAPLSIGF